MAEGTYITARIEEWPNKELGTLTFYNVLPRAGEYIDVAEFRFVVKLVTWRSRSTGYGTSAWQPVLKLTKCGTLHE